MEVSDSDVDITGFTCKCPDCLAQAAQFLPIPNPASGGQRTETGKPCRHRITSKRTEQIPQTVAADHPKPSMKKRRRKQTIRASRAETVNIELPVKTITRKASTKRTKEVHLMMGKGAGRYVAGCSENQSSRCDGIIEDLKKKIEGKVIKTLGQARQFVLSEISKDK
eukprot:5728571-Pyramimonas_sp.AAC.1